MKTLNSHESTRTLGLALRRNEWTYGSCIRTHHSGMCYFKARTPGKPRPARIAQAPNSLTLCFDVQSTNPQPPPRPTVTFCVLSPSRWWVPYLLYFRNQCISPNLWFSLLPNIVAHYPIFGVSATDAWWWLSFRLAGQTWKKRASAFSHLLAWTLFHSN